MKDKREEINPYLLPIFDEEIKGISFIFGKDKKIPTLSNVLSSFRSGEEISKKMKKIKHMEEIALRPLTKWIKEDNFKHAQHDRKLGDLNRTALVFRCFGKTIQVLNGVKPPEGLKGITIIKKEDGIRIIEGRNGVTFVYVPASYGEIDEDITIKQQKDWKRISNKLRAKARRVWIKHYGKIPPNHHIHHKDDNPFNNDISNLECLTKEEHKEKHPFNGVGNINPNIKEKTRNLTHKKISKKQILKETIKEKRNSIAKALRAAGADNKEIIKIINEVKITK